MHEPDLSCCWMGGGDLDSICTIGGYSFGMQSLDSSLRSDFEPFCRRFSCKLGEYVSVRAACREQNDRTDTFGLLCLCLTPPQAAPATTLALLRYCLRFGHL